MGRLVVHFSRSKHTKTRKPLKMKQTIFLTLFVLAFSAMAQDEATTTTVAATTTTAPLATCTEADNLSEYTICQSLETTCTGYVAICSGVNSCLDAIADSYTVFFDAFDFTGVTTCACTEFTCSSTGVDYGNGESSTASLVASLGLVGLMKLFL